jgi:hypothetical protein
MGAQTLPDQCWFAAQLLQDNQTPAVPYSFIGNTQGIGKGEVKCHHTLCETAEPLARHSRRPPLATEEQREELVQRIAEVDQHDRPWKTREILEFTQERSQQRIYTFSPATWLESTATS